MNKIIFKYFCQMNKSLPSKMRFISVINSNNIPELKMTEGDLPVIDIKKEF